MKKNKSIDDYTNICGKLCFPAAEAYKLLRTSVQYSFTDNNRCKVIGITSSERNEGKTTLAVNLAYMLSCDKKRVLLLDGDLRLPKVSKALDLDPTPGLSDYLIGIVKNDEGIQHSEKAPALSVICSGVEPPNPSELLGSASMERVLTSLKAAFDYIIVDLPPVNIVSDPLSIAKYLDGFIVAVRSEFSTKQGVQDVVKKLQIVDAKILGFVINDFGKSSGGKHSKRGRFKR